MHRYINRLFLALLFAASLPVMLVGQVNVNGGQTPQQYLDAFSGQGVVSFGPSYIGDPVSIGSFDVQPGGPDFGINSGIILSTGDATDLQTITSNTADGTGFTSNGGSDPDLAGLITVPVDDAAVFRFSFVPDRDSVAFRYVFASEEYNEFAPPNSSSFNDVFAFFISGPGIVGKQNIALIPGTTTPVSINNVNQVTNQAFYNSNDPGDTPFGSPSAEVPNFTFDGFTDVLTAVATNLNPCDTYLLELKIGDGGDSSFDSAVLLEAGSFGNTVSVPGAIFAGLNDDCQLAFEINEGCDLAELQIVKPEGQAVVSDTTYLDYTGSSADTVTDFTSPLPNFVVFPPGVDTIFVPIQAVTDTLTEPNDSLVFRSINNGIASRELVIRILDSDTLSLASQTLYTACKGDLITINPDVVGGTLPEEDKSYSWIVGADTISTDSILETQVDSSFNVQLYVEDTCGVVPGKWFITISTDYAPTPLTVSSISNDKIICEGDSVTLETSATGGFGAYNYLWVDPSGNTVDTLSSITFEPTESGTYTVFVQDTCLIRSETVDLTIEDIPSVDFLLSSDTICGNDVLDVAFVGADTSAVNYSWAFSGGQPSTGSGIGPFTINYATSDTFDITLTAQGQVCVVDTTQEVVVAPVPQIAAGPDKTVCFGNDVLLEGSVNHPFAGTAFCDIQWQEVGSGFSPGTNPQQVVPNMFDSTSYVLTATCGGCVGEPDTMRVNVAPPPNVTVANNLLEKCEGDPAVSTFINPIGEQPLTVSWSPSLGVNTSQPQFPAFNPNSTTTYELIVTDGNGCVLPIPEEITVNVNEAPEPNAGADVSICAGDDVSLNGSATGGTGSYQYSWTPTTGLTPPNVANPTAAPSVSTQYTLSVTDLGTGCVSKPSAPNATVAVDVTSLPAFAPSATDVDICNGDSAGIGVLSIANNPDYTFSWSPTTGLADPTSGYTQAAPTSTTTYELTVSRDGCAGDPIPITVNVTNNPTVSIPPVDPICPANGSVTLNPNIAGVGADVEYSWTPTTGLSDPTSPTPTATPLSPTTYVLEVSHGSGCVDTASVFVGIAGVGPDFDADVDTEHNSRSLCADATGAGVTFTAAAPASASGQWLTGGATGNTLSVNPQVTTNYVWEASFGNGCVARDTATVFVKPGVDITYDVENDSVCYGDTVAVSVTAGTGAGDIIWIDNAGVDCDTCFDVTIVPPVTSSNYITSYDILVSENGCIDSATIELSAYPQPIADFSYSPESGCQPLEVNFQNYSTNADAYVWDFDDDSTSSSFDPTHIYEATGQYRPQLIAYAGPDSQCVDTFQLSGRNFIDVKDSIIVNFTADPDTADTLYIPAATVDFTDSTTNAVAWYWDFGDGMSSSFQNPSHTWQVPGEYTVTLFATANGGCQDTMSMGPFVVDIEELPAIPSVFTPNGDDINDEFWVDYTGDQSFELTVLNRTGAVMFNSTNPQERWKPDPNTATTGVYFYIVKIGDKTYDGTVTLLK